LSKCPLIDEQTVLKFAAINGAQKITSDTLNIDGNQLHRKGQEVTTITRPPLVTSL
jgi:hypothetical protein